jgi:hypothetical protein
MTILETIRGLSEQPGWSGCCLAEDASWPATRLGCRARRQHQASIGGLRLFSRPACLGETIRFSPLRASLQGRAAGILGVAVRHGGAAEFGNGEVGKEEVGTAEVSAAEAGNEEVSTAEVGTL